MGMSHVRKSGEGWGIENRYWCLLKLFDGVILEQHPPVWLGVILEQHPPVWPGLQFVLCFVLWLLAHSRCVIEVRWRRVEEFSAWNLIFSASRPVTRGECELSAACAAGLAVPGACALKDYCSEFNTACFQEAQEILAELCQNIRGRAALCTNPAAPPQMKSAVVLVILRAHNHRFLLSGNPTAPHAQA